MVGSVFYTHFDTINIYYFYVKCYVISAMKIVLNPCPVLVAVMSGASGAIYR